VCQIDVYGRLSTDSGDWTSVVALSACSFSSSSFRSSSSKPFTPSLSKNLVELLLQFVDVFHSQFGEDVPNALRLIDSVDSRASVSTIHVASLVAAAARGSSERRNRSAASLLQIVLELSPAVVCRRLLVPMATTVGTNNSTAAAAPETSGPAAPRRCMAAALWMPSQTARTEAKPHSWKDHGIVLGWRPASQLCCGWPRQALAAAAEEEEEELTIPSWQWTCKLACVRCSLAMDLQHISNSQYTWRQCTSGRKWVSKKIQGLVGRSIFCEGRPVFLRLPRNPSSLCVLSRCTAASLPRSFEKI